MATVVKKNDWYYYRKTFYRSATCHIKKTARSVDTSFFTFGFIFSVCKADNQLYDLLRGIGFITLCGGATDIALKKHFSDMIKSKQDAFFFNINRVLRFSDENGVRTYKGLEPDIFGEFFVLRGGYYDNQDGTFNPKPFVVNDELIENALITNPDGFGLFLIKYDKDFDQNNLMKWIDASIKIINDSEENKAIDMFLRRLCQLCFIATCLKRTNVLDEIISKIQKINKYSNEVRIRFMALFVDIFQVFVLCYDDDMIDKYTSILNDFIANNHNIRSVRIGELYVAINVINAYGYREEFNKLEEWGARLINVLNIFPEDVEIYIEVASACVNAIGRYGEKGRFSELERWIKQLDYLCLKYPNDLRLRIEEAKAVALSVYFYGLKNKSSEMELFIKRFEPLRTLFSNDREIVIREAKSLFNVIDFYIKRDNYSQAEMHAIVFDKIINVYKTYIEIRELENLIVFRAINHILQPVKYFSPAIPPSFVFNRLEWLDHWEKRLDNIVTDLPAHLSFRLMESDCILLAVFAFNIVDKQKEMIKWFLRYENINKHINNDVEICINEFKSMFIICDHYLENGNDDAFENMYKTINLFIKNRKLEYHPFVLEYSIYINLSIMSHSILKYDYINKEIIDTINKAPWLILTKHKNKNVCIFAQESLMNRQNENAIVQLTSDYLNTIIAMQEFLNHQNDINLLKQLWQKRLYIENWGKPLWEHLIKHGEKEWINDALNDPWTTEEDRHELMQLRDGKHEQNNPNP